LVANSIAEVEIIRPIDPEFLVVARTAQPKVNLCSTHELLVGQEEAAVHLLTIRSVCVDLAFGINAPQQTVAVPPRGVATNDNDLALARRPLALDAIQPSAEVENEVVTTTLA